MMTKKRWGDISGIVLVLIPYIEPFIPKSVFEVVGFAALPGEISQWRDAVMFSLPHLLLWLPVALGLGLLLFLNWEYVSEKIKNPALRIGLAAVLVSAGFFIPSFSPSFAQQSGSPPSSDLSADAHGTNSSIGSDNTLVGVNPPANMGSNNTFVGPTDNKGNAIYNKGGTAIGANSCAGQSDVAIGAGAHAGSC